MIINNYDYNKQIISKVSYNSYDNKIIIHFPPI